MTATLAYRASARHRSPKQQEADVFLRVNASLRGADTQQDALARTKAIADNTLLWTAVMDTLRAPDNQLPLGVRASIISVGHAVQRENGSPVPDLAFLIGINEQIAAGLAGL